MSSPNAWVVASVHMCAQRDRCSRRSHHLTRPSSRQALGTVDAASFTPISTTFLHLLGRHDVVAEAGSTPLRSGACRLAQPILSNPSRSPYLAIQVEAARHILSAIQVEAARHILSAIQVEAARHILGAIQVGAARHILSAIQVEAARHILSASLQHWRNARRVAPHRVGSRERGATKR